MEHKGADQLRANWVELVKYESVQSYSIYASSIASLFLK